METQELLSVAVLLLVFSFTQIDLTRSFFRKKAFGISSENLIFPLFDTYDGYCSFLLLRTVFFDKSRFFAPGIGELHGPHNKFRCIWLRASFPRSKVLRFDWDIGLLESL